MRRIAWVLGDIDAGVGEPVGHVAAHRVRATRIQWAPMPVPSFGGGKESRRDGGTPPRLAARLGATGQQGPSTLG